MYRIAAASLVLIFVLSSFAGAQPWAEKMFKVRRHDFGTVARHSKQIFEFELQNIYQEEVRIAGVRASCGCATPSISKQTLKTWESGAVVVKYNTESFLGQKSATITVTIDRPYHAEVQLQINGFIRSDVVLNPGVVEFGEVQPGTPVERHVALAYAGRNDWQISDIRSNNDYVEVEMEQTSRGGGRVDYQLSVRLKEDAPAGYLNDYLYLLTNDGRAAIPLAMNGRVLPAVTISPASLFMGSLAPGEEATRQLVVRASKPFRVKNILCDDKRFEFAPGGDAKALHVIPVTFTSDKPGKVACRIAIETDLPGGTAEFVASATVVDQPRVANDR